MKCTRYFLCALALAGLTLSSCEHLQDGLNYADIELGHYNKVEAGSGTFGAFRSLELTLEKPTSDK